MIAASGCMQCLTISLRLVANNARSLRLRHAQAADWQANACGAAEAAAAEQQRYFCSVMDVLQPNFTALALAERNVTVGSKIFVMTMHAQAGIHSSEPLLPLCIQHQNMSTNGGAAEAQFDSYASVRLISVCSCLTTTVL